MNITVFKENDSFIGNDSNLELFDKPASENIDLYFKSLMTKFAVASYGKHYEICFPVTFVVCAIGTITNIFNVVVFTRKNMINSINFFLAALSVADILLILTQFPYPIHYFMGFRYIFEYQWNTFYISLVFSETVTMTLCNWLVVIIGTWRFVAIQWPLSVSRLCSLPRARVVVALLCLFSIIISLPIYVFLTNVEYNIKSRKIYAKGFSEYAAKHPTLLESYWAALSLVAFIPCVVMVIISCLLVWRLVMLRRQRDSVFVDRKMSSSSRTQNSQSNRITVMLLVVLLLFILNNLPDSCLLLVASFSHGDEASHKEAQNATEFLRLFSMVNNSASFFIYYVMAVNFRKTFKKCFCSFSKLERKLGSSNATVYSQTSEYVTGNQGVDIPMSDTVQVKN